MTRNPLRSDEQAVSPVIGVILMVAITVILAAVIGSMVIGIGQDSVSQQASAGVSEAGNNAVTLTSLGPNTEGIYCSDDDKDNDDATVTQVGKTLDCSDGGGGADSVVAYGTDVQDATVYTFDN